jgi:hypothetical protein
LFCFCFCFLFFFWFHSADVTYSLTGKSIAPS